MFKKIASLASCLIVGLVLGQALVYGFSLWGSEKHADTSGSSPGASAPGAASSESSQKLPASQVAVEATNPPVGIASFAPLVKRVMPTGGFVASTATWEA